MIIFKKCIPHHVISSKIFKRRDDSKSVLQLDYLFIMLPISKEHNQPIRQSDASSKVPDSVLHPELLYNAENNYTVAPNILKVIQNHEDWMCTVRIC